MKASRFTDAQKAFVVKQGDLSPKNSSIYGRICLNNWRQIMKRRFSDEQIISMIKEQENGM
ncbi:hypothetical protein, partial [Lentilitoribacter sp. EG35]|uniref:hypothetical protein n=1 Tax=Lentilitoribacter sp. EG35 TaxID=3234192 RepID=UPI0034610B27